MSQYEIRVSADTQQATTQLKKVDKAADAATRERKIKLGVPDLNKIEKQYKNVKSNVQDAANSIKTFYKVAKVAPGIGDTVQNIEDLAKGTANAAKSAPQLASALKDSSAASNILGGSVRKTNDVLMTMVTNLAKVGFAVYAVKEAVGLLQAAFGGFFNDTIGREIQLRETLLKTQTTLASTSKVFKNGKEIVDPLEKIKTLTGAVNDNIASIRERSLELAGVTSGEVIEVFGMVAQQISSIGGGLKEAEDLAIQFAAALGTFGIPLYQARQEIGSILRGDITMDSYLAKSLGITNEDIAKAKSEVGGVVGFLEDRLKAAVAGQELAAKGFAGVVSNIAEIGEEVKRNFGAGLLDPLLGGLTNVYDLLFKISKQAFKAANDIGKALGGSLSNLAVLFGGAGVGAISIGADLAKSITEGVEGAINTVKGAITTVMAPIKSVFAEIGKAIALMASGLGQLAQAFASLQIEKFKALVTALAAVAPLITAVAYSFSELLKVYAELLRQPIVKYFAQIGVTMKVVEAVGVKFAVQMVAFATVIIAKWKPMIAFFAGLGAKIAGSLGLAFSAINVLAAQVGGVIAALANVLLTAVPKSEALAASLTKLAVTMGAVSKGAATAGTKVTVMGGAMAGAATKVGGAIAGMIKLNLIIFAVVGTISLLIDLFGRWQRQQEKEARRKGAEQSLKRLTSGYYDLEKGLDAATRARKEYDEAAVQSQVTAIKEELKGVLDEIAALEERTKNWTSKAGLAYRATNLAPLKEKEEKLLKELNRLDFEQKKATADDVIKLEKANRVNLEKEIKELRRGLADDEFRYRQRLARAEIDRFRAQSQLELQRMDGILKARLKNEEGISRQFLQNLGEYLKQKKRGEDEIGARQKELQLTLASLQKEIADYKYNTEKKIAELQKKMGEYQKGVADYRLDRAKQAEQTGGAGGALVDLISRTESYGGNYGAFNREGRDDGHTAIGSGIDDGLVKRKISDIMAEQAAGGIHAVGKYQIIGPTMKGLMDGAYGATGVTPNMPFSPENQDKLFKALARNRIVSENPEATMSGLRQEWIGLQNIADKDLLPAVKELMRSANSLTEAAQATEAAETLATPPDLAGLEGVDPSKITASLETLKGVLADINALKDELTNEQIAAQFESITEGLFGNIQIEPLKDQLTEVLGIFEATAASAERLNEATRADIKFQSELNRKTIERDAVLKSIAESESLAAEEKAALTEKTNTEFDEYVAKLREALGLQQQIVGVQEAQVALESMLSAKKQIEQDTQATILRMQMEGEGYSDIEINAAQQKAAAYQSMQEAIGKLNADIPEQAAAIKKLQKEYAKLVSTIDTAAKVQTELANPLRQLFVQWKRDLKDINGYYAQMAQVVTSELGRAMSNALTGIITGTTTVKEAFGQMFSNIGKAFIDMATQMIAKALMMKVLGIFMPGAGAGFNIGSALVGGGGGGGGLLGMAQGAYVNSATPALIGEGGSPEYVIPENKMSSTMARWSMGMRGKGVVEGADSSFGSQNRSGNQPTALGDVSKRYNPGNNYSSTNNYGEGASASDSYAINITGEQLVFNEKNYVSQEEIPNIISQASQQGEARTLRRLRMSQTSRQRIGMR